MSVPDKPNMSESQKRGDLLDMFEIDYLFLEIDYLRLRSIKSMATS